MILEFVSIIYFVMILSLLIWDWFSVEKHRKDIGELMLSRKEIREMYFERMQKEIGQREIERRQQQHEDDLNGIIVNQETRQTAEMEEFGIFPQFVDKDKEKNHEGYDRFELLDL